MPTFVFGRDASLASCAWVLACALACSGCARRGDGGGAQQSRRERASYALGYSAGSGFRPIGAELDLEQLRRGLLDGLRAHGEREHVLSRPERIAQLRRVAKRVQQAQLDALSERLDREQYR